MNTFPDGELMPIVSAIASGTGEEPMLEAMLAALVRASGADGGRIQRRTCPGSPPSEALFAHSMELFLDRPGRDGLSLLLGRSDRAFDDGEKARGEALAVAMVPLVEIRRCIEASEAAARSMESSLHESARRLDILLEGSHDMVYSVDAEDVFTSVNSAGLALLGLDDRSKAIGRPFQDFVYNGPDRARFVRKLYDRGYVNDFEIILKTDAGASRFCLESAKAVRDDSGSIVAIQGSIKDISDRIAQEREIWKANMELAEANGRIKEAEVLMVQHEKLASIGQLAAGVAHEINNPLGFLTSNHSVLIQFIKTIRDAWEAVVSAAPQALDIAKSFDLSYIFEETETMMRETDDGLRRILSIVKNLKSFARSEMETAIAPFDLNQGINDTLVVARNEIKYVADVELRLGDIPPIEAAGGEINQVLLNLVVNAAQAIEEQKRKDRGRIGIETRLAGDIVVCEISDDGPGVPPELKHRIFDPFFSTKGPGKGTGLGLSISYDIIAKKHGGGLSIERSPAGGALFRIELPIRQARQGEGMGRPAIEGGEPEPGDDEPLRFEGAVG
jgi:two-component system, NtrC family, sensor kinase